MDNWIMEWLCWHCCLMAHLVGGWGKWSLDRDGILHPINIWRLLCTTETPGELQELRQVVLQETVKSWTIAIQKQSRGTIKTKFQILSSVEDIKFLTSSIAPMAGLVPAFETRISIAPSCLSVSSISRSRSSCLATWQAIPSTLKW